MPVLRYGRGWRMLLVTGMLLLLTMSVAASPFTPDATPLTVVGPVTHQNTEDPVDGTSDCENTPAVTTVSYLATRLGCAP